MPKRRMSMRDAMDLVPDDMPDGAYWAMAHEIAVLDYGDGFDELLSDDIGTATHPKPPKRFGCGDCARRFASKHALSQHRRDKHTQSKDDANG